MSKVFTVIKLVFGWIVYGLSFLFPRDKETWIFLGWRRDMEREIFADNSKYLFLYVSNHLKNIRAIWIGKDEKIALVLRARGLKSYSRYSMRGIYYSLRAGMTIADAYLELSNWQWSGGTKFIQLWHGKGPKKMGFNSPYGLKNYNHFLYPYLFKKAVFQIAASPFTKTLVASSFDIPLKKVFVTGLPKYDVFVSEEPGADIDVHADLKEKIEKAKTNSKRVVLYAPTFRPDGTNPIDKIDLQALDSSLNEGRVHMILSLHPKFSGKVWMPKQSFKNLEFVSAGYDIYPLLSTIDALISDYSSTYVDFLLIDKPIFFFSFDIDMYKEKMGLHEEFWDLMPGPQVTNLTDLVKELTRSEDLFKEKRAHARNVLFSFTDGKSSNRVAEEILKTA